MVSFDEALAAGKVTPEEAAEMFDSLPALRPKELIGLWKGQSFLTGSPQDGQLESSGWYGREFIDENTVHPLVFKSKDNGRFAVDPLKAMALASQGTHLPDAQSEAETKEAKARIRVVEFRGMATASMVYNQLPIIDSFRKVDDNTLLGAMENVQLPSPYFFVLGRQI
ncbi:hypothetical protein F66182_6174 [Fusarium sp. NRRL 66182]|nr:hypothetical protein F66182_6174 [Fusarium sp. NRRL 66182]